MMNDEELLALLDEEEKETQSISCHYVYTPLMGKKEEDYSDAPYKCFAGKKTTKAEYIAQVMKDNYWLDTEQAEQMWYYLLKPWREEN